MERLSCCNEWHNRSSVGGGMDAGVGSWVNRRCCASTLRGKKEQTVLTDLDLS